MPGAIRQLHGDPAGERGGEDVDSWWREGGGAEIHHFIGKDITYFHTLFWPGMLNAAQYNMPTKVHIHGFLNVDGKKMSKRLKNYPDPKLNGF